MPLELVNSIRDIVDSKKRKPKNKKFQGPEYNMLAHVPISAIAVK